MSIARLVSLISRLFRGGSMNKTDDATAIVDDWENVGSQNDRGGQG